MIHGRADSLLWTYGETGPSKQSCSLHGEATQQKVSQSPPLSFYQLLPNATERIKTLDDMSLWGTPQTHTTGDHKTMSITNQSLREGTAEMSQTPDALHVSKRNINKYTSSCPLEE